jgi:hypothetical protein
MQYTVEAHSPSLNQTLRQLDLTTDNMVGDPLLAQQLAEAFANLQNTRQHMQARDWVAVVNQF